MKNIYLILIAILLIICSIDLIDSCNKLDKIINNSLLHKTKVIKTINQNSNEKSSKVYLNSLFK